MGDETEMDSQKPEDIDDRVLEEVPEDVAVLYSWANLQGAKYRDFSASRREFRAQMRKRAAEAQREAEIRLKAEAEAAATAAERAAQEAEEAARFHETEARRAAAEYRQQDSHVEQQARERALQHAQELSRRAHAERIEAARRAEAIAAAEAAAQREAREMAEARASAERQATRYAESEAYRKAMAGPQPDTFIPGVMSDPYMDHHVATPPPERIFHTPALSEEDMRATRLPRTREERAGVPSPEESGARRAEKAYWESVEAAHKAEGHAAQEAAATPNANYFYEPDTQERVAAVDQYVRQAPYRRTSDPAHPVYLYKAPTGEPEPAMAAPQPPAPVAAPSAEYVEEPAASFYTPEPPYVEPEPPPAVETNVPAWLNPASEAHTPVIEPQRPAPPPVADTLQTSRERVAARWYALKGIMDAGGQEAKGETIHPRTHDARTPLIAVFSISGGVGKTSMVATLGRALSSLGEHVLLADTTLHGLLPFYFGASELRPGMVRTFSPRPGTNHAPVAMASYDVSSKTGDALSEEWLSAELARTAGDVQRVLLDLSPSSPWVLRHLARLNTLILVPVSPDMNSVISLGAVERFFSGVTDSDGHVVKPLYVLNGFDASLPLHLDVREVMRQKLGDRLLPFVIRRSPAVAEALAEGMTVMDYAPESAVAGDYMHLASWLRSQSLPAESGTKNVRWSER
ncbi:MAG TPA: cellulose synthase operon protein YhjQ/BcsQ [Acidobacteriaceae bacterium]|jgi:cellulose synthase operon protein YhjQ